MKKLLLLLLFPLMAAMPPGGQKKPRNIILLIGDGMGLTHLTAALYAGKAPLNIEAFPVTGLVKTRSARHLITDSAAAGTALACGCKTLNGRIGLDLRKQPCTTLLEQAVQRGLATGIVVNSSLTHATPAAFIAHVRHRDAMEEIATYFLKTPTDFLVGGGMKYFSNRTDGQNLIGELTRRDWQVSSYQHARLDTLRPDPARPFVWFSAWEEPPAADQDRDYLPKATALAQDFLKQRSEAGFFLLVEGSQIDWASHKNQATTVVMEVQDFDKAVGEALRFAQADGETLVIVTADHETGGMALITGRDRENAEITFNSSAHTASLVPVFAYGPGSEAFHGMYDNTELYRKMREALGFPEIAIEGSKAE